MRICSSFCPLVRRSVKESVEKVRKDPECCFPHSVHIEQDAASLVFHDIGARSLQTKVDVIFPGEAEFPLSRHDRPHLTGKREEEKHSEEDMDRNTGLG